MVRVRSRRVSACAARAADASSLAQGILERMNEIELEMQRTQKNKVRGLLGRGLAACC